MGATKIATCCYCGTRAALILRGKDKHELACSNCGAPLRSLKMLPKHSSEARGRAAEPVRSSQRKRVEKYPEYRGDRPKKRRKSKSFGKRMMSGLWDVVEDVVDEIFD